jgi:hypothetical protein
LAVTAATLPSAMSEDEDEEDQEDDAIELNGEDDNNFDGDEEAEKPTLSAPGRFLTASTYAPAPGKTTGTKKAKAWLYGAGPSRRKS